MAESFAASIEVGGRLPRVRLDELLAAARADGAGIDWDEPIVSVSDIVAAIVPGEPLTFTDPDASYGQFRTVEAYCQVASLTFRRESVPHGEFAGEVVFWRPGMDQPLSTSADATGEPYLTSRELRSHLAAERDLAEVIAWLEARDGTVPAFETAD